MDTKALPKCISMARFISEGVGGCQKRILKRIRQLPVYSLSEIRLGEGDSPHFAARTAQKGDSPRRFWAAMPGFWHTRMNPRRERGVARWRLQASKTPLLAPRVWMRTVG